MPYVAERLIFPEVCVCGAQSSPFMLHMCISEGGREESVCVGRYYKWCVCVTGCTLTVSTTRINYEFIG